MLGANGLGERPFVDAESGHWPSPCTNGDAAREWSGPGVPDLEALDMLPVSAALQLWLTFSEARYTAVGHQSCPQDRR